MPSMPIPPRQALVAAGVLLAVLVLAGRMLADAGAPAVRPVAPLVPESAGTAETLVVHVAGAVRQPGLYELKEGSRVSDAVARAGGATARADTAAVNLAAPLADGIQVLIPSRVAGAAGAGSGPSGVGGPAPRVSLS